MYDFVVVWKEDLYICDVADAKVDGAVVKCDRVDSIVDVGKLELAIVAAVEFGVTFSLQLMLHKSDLQHCTRQDPPKI
jgi:hypothetical protein